MANNIQSVMQPKSIAVVGASREPGRIGHDVLANLIAGGYAGALYPINVKADGDILGKPVFSSLTAVGKSIDLVVFAVPAAVVAPILREAGELGIHGAIVITAGFKEVGNTAGEEELIAIAREYDMALIGPNCLGVISSASDMNASFATKMPPKGAVGFLSQSGAVCTAVLDRASILGVGFSHFVSVGNKAVTDEAELLAYLLDDDATSVIGMYLEDVAHPARFREVIADARARGVAKPIVVLKSGRTEVGASASASHTGALAGKDEAYDAFFAQAGVLRSDRMSEFFDTLRACAHTKAPTGPRVAIITNAGGPGVLATDAVVRVGLEVPRLCDKTRTALAPHLPPAASTANPVDLLGDANAKRYAQGLEIVGNDPDVDALLVLLTPQTSTEIEATAQAIIDAHMNLGKPVVASFMGGETVEPGARMLTDAGVTVTAFPEEAAAMLATIRANAAAMKTTTDTVFNMVGVDAKKSSALLAEATKGGRVGIPEAEAVEIFAAYGVPTLQSTVVGDRAEAERAAARIGRKMVMKIVSDDILHKSDAGGVRLNIAPEEAGDAYDALMETVRARRPDAKLDGVLVVEMAPQGGVEAIVGVTRDPALGHLVMVGLGGIYVEVLKDVAFGVVPLTRNDAQRMVDSLKTRALFDGVRGGPALDVDALIEVIGRVSDFVVHHPNVAEIDLNPVLVLPKGQGVCALDARIIMESPNKE